MGGPRARQWEGTYTVGTQVFVHVICCVRYGLPWGSARDVGVDRLLPLEWEYRSGDWLHGWGTDAWL